MKAIAVFQKNLTGYISFIQDSKDGDVRINGVIKGLTPGKHGIHIHRYGNLMSVNCMGCGGHFNPLGRNHGGRYDKESHAGDLGNITANKDGVSRFRFVLRKKITLFGKHCIFGRSIVVHAEEDDLGKGGHHDSLTTGHSGGRVDCAVIGIMNED